MIQDIMPGTEQQLDKLRLNGEITSGYIGFDPTADSLHIGSLVPILLLVHLQRAGHKPVALVGGATGMVGDPSGKSEERNLLSEEVLNHNLAGVKRQLEKYLDFSPNMPNGALIVNNYDWFRNMTFLDFIRDIGKHITVNYMSSKDSVKKRLEGENGMSFTEFTYQLVQGYDFYWLYANKNCKLQMGGSDQWGNITTGTELIRRKSGGEAFAFTCPLLTKADGGKFGKTEKGNIWLDPEKTSPYLFYQFWLNASDTDAEKWIKIFTFLDRAEIEILIDQHRENPGTRVLQKRLAREITVFVHGESEFEQVLSTTEKLFGQSSGKTAITLDDILQLPGVAQFPISGSRIEDGIDFPGLLYESGSFSSKGEARKMILQGGLSMNGSKLEDASKRVSKSDFVENLSQFQKGKKTYFLIKAFDTIEEFDAEISLKKPSGKIGSPSISPSADGQMGAIVTISGIWDQDALDWSIRESANTASYFEFTYLPNDRLTFYLQIIVDSKDGSASREKWIRFEPSYSKTDTYDLNIDQHEMAYVNKVVRENSFEKSIVDISKAVSETFGQGGWIYNKALSFRVRGQGSIKRVLFGI